MRNIVKEPSNKAINHKLLVKTLDAKKPLKPYCQIVKKQCKKEYRELI